MREFERKLCQRIFRERKIESLEDIARELVTFMCHINQEPEVFDTKLPRNWSNYKSVRMKTSVAKAVDYLKKAVKPEYGTKAFSKDSKRFPCTCRNMAEVGGHLAAHLLQEPVFVLGRVSPFFMSGTRSKHRHYLNCAFENGDPRFFDFSVYKFLGNISGEGRFVLDGVTVEEYLEQFDAMNIDFEKYIHWTSGNRAWLQKGNVQRNIEFRNGEVIDNCENVELEEGYYHKRIYP